jgi:Zn-dependent protease
VETSQAILMFGTLIISLTVHEAAHAFLAWRGGDPTAYHRGQVSLNPIPHIMREPFGMVILPALMLFAFKSNFLLGYASTPIDPEWAWRHPRRAALMSAGGPLANLLLATIGFIVLSMTGEAGVPAHDREPVAKMAEAFLRLNLVLFLFNLFPLPPLDGAGVVEGLFPRTRSFYDMLRRNSTAALIGILAVVFAMREIAPTVYWTVMGWLA